MLHLPDRSEMNLISVHNSNEVSTFSLGFGHMGQPSPRGEVCSSFKPEDGNQEARLVPSISPWIIADSKSRMGRLFRATNPTCQALRKGHWQLAGGHGKEPLEDPSANMRNHFAAGITTFDTAGVVLQCPVSQELQMDKCLRE